MEAANDLRVYPRLQVSMVSIRNAGQHSGLTDYGLCMYERVTRTYIHTYIFHHSTQALVDRIENVGYTTTFYSLDPIPVFMLAFCAEIEWDS